MIIYEQFERVRRRFPEYSRKDLRLLDAPMYQRLRAVAGDRLAERQLALRVHGYPTLINWIYADHGLPLPY